jgi:hypothetical protein
VLAAAAARPAAAAQAAAGSGSQRLNLQSQQIKGLQRKDICDGPILLCYRLLPLLRLLRPLLLLLLPLSLPLHRPRRQQLQLQHQPHSST